MSFFLYMKTILLFLVLFLHGLCAAAQASDEDYIDWSAVRRLTWSDYQGTPLPGSDAVASTFSILGISYRISNNSFQYSIECRFSKTNSWGLHKTSYILKHEQGHFDITELFARILHQHMSEYRFSRASYKKDLQQIYQDVLKKKDNMQQAYDRETKHSINREKQEFWLKKIEAMLKETEAFSGY